MKNGEDKRRCPLCRGHMVLGNTNLPYELGEEQMIVVRHVPAIICEQCGENFIEIKVTRELEKIVERARRDGMTMGFLEYEKAA